MRLPAVPPRDSRRIKRGLCPCWRRIYDEMCRGHRRLPRCRDEAKDIRDKVLAIEVYAGQARNTDAEDQAREIRIRAERRCGELLAPDVSQRAGRGRPGKTSSDPRLSDLGITYDQSSQWQKLAEVPEETFESALKEPGAKPSTSGIIARHASETRPPAPKDYVDPKALWLWGRLQEFEREGLLAIDEPSALFATMLEHQRATTKRLAPLVADVAHPVDRRSAARVRPWFGPARYPTN